MTTEILLIQREATSRCSIGLTSLADSRAIIACRACIATHADSMAGIGFASTVSTFVSPRVSTDGTRPKDKKSASTKARQATLANFG